MSEPKELPDPLNPSTETSSVAPSTADLNFREEVIRFGQILMRELAVREALVNQQIIKTTEDLIIPILAKAAIQQLDPSYDPNETLKLYEEAARVVELFPESFKEKFVTCIGLNRDNAKKGDIEGTKTALHRVKTLTTNEQILGLLQQMIVSIETAGATPSRPKNSLRGMLKRVFTFPTFKSYVASERIHGSISPIKFF